MRARTASFSALALSALFLPFIAAAQHVQSVLNVVLSILNGAIFLFITIAIVVFFWGLVSYLANIGGEDAAKKGIQLMLWGIIALFVMVSVWGLIHLLQNTFLNGVSSQAVSPSTFNPQGTAGSITINPGSITIPTPPLN